MAVINGALVPEAGRRTICLCPRCVGVCTGQAGVSVGVFVGGMGTHAGTDCILLGRGCSSREHEQLANTAYLSCSTTIVTLIGATVTMPGIPSTRISTM
jgi:hypothetical protein